MVIKKVKMAKFFILIVTRSISFVEYEGGGKTFLNFQLKLKQRLLILLNFNATLALILH